MAVNEAGRTLGKIRSGWHITNVSDSDTLISEVSLIKPKVLGEITLSSIVEPYGPLRMLHPGVTAWGTVVFSVENPTFASGEKLNLKVQFVDRYENRLRKNISDVPEVPSPMTDRKEFVREAVSRITDTVEKQVATVLQAEVDRYASLSRWHGGLGSIQTTYKGQSYPGMLPDFGRTGTAALQSIISDPENAKIESDNASTLLKLYEQLEEADKERCERALFERLTQFGEYSSIRYFILFVLYRIGKLEVALETLGSATPEAPSRNVGNSPSLLNGLLRCEYPNFTSSMLDAVERFIYGMGPAATGIRERVSAVRAVLLQKSLKKPGDPTP
jgi:hypothetical protein